MWAAFGLLAGSVVGFTDDQACHFVASQYAHSASRCGHGTCTELFTMQNGVFTQDGNFAAATITCTEARMVMDQFLSQYAPEDMAFKRRRSDVSDGERFVQSLDQHVLAAIRVVISGVQADSFELSQILSCYIDDLRRSASRNPAAFSSEILPALNTSTAVAQLGLAVPELIKITLTSSWLDSDQMDLLTAALYFYFDISALIGRPLTAAQKVSDARFIIQTQAPGYRGHYSREFRYPSWLLGVPRTPTKLIELSGAIERFAAGPDREDTQAMLNLFAGWDASVSNAADSLLLHHIVSAVCPRIESVIVALRGVGINGGECLKLGVTLIDVCEHAVSPMSLQAAQEAVAALAHGPAAHMQLPNLMDEAPEAIFFNNQLTWGAPFQFGMAPSDAVVAGIVHSFFVLLAELVPLATGYNRLPVGADIDALRATGRAIGLAIRCAVPVRFMRIAPSLVNLLHPHMRFDADMDVFAELMEEIYLSPANQSVVIDSIHYVSSGIADALGPGGFERINPARWLALFVD